MPDNDITQEFIGRQLALVLEHVGAIEDQMMVQTAIIRRLDGTVSGFIDEVRRDRQHARQPQSPTAELG